MGHGIAIGMVRRAMVVAGFREQRWTHRIGHRAGPAAAPRPRGSGPGPCRATASLPRRGGGTIVPIGPRIDAEPVRSRGPAMKRAGWPRTPGPDPQRPHGRGVTGLTAPGHPGPQLTDAAVVASAPGSGSPGSPASWILDQPTPGSVGIRRRPPVSTRRDAYDPPRPGSKNIRVSTGPPLELWLRFRRSVDRKKPQDSDLRPVAL